MGKLTALDGTVLRSTKEGPDNELRAVVQKDGNLNMTIGRDWSPDRLFVLAGHITRAANRALSIQETIQQAQQRAKQEEGNGATRES